MMQLVNKNEKTAPHLAGYNHSQKGAVLIIVLFVLILIMLVGAIAIRSGTTDLKVSTAAQVNKILFQANDAALMKVEKEDRILGANRGSADTLKVYMSSPRRAGHEVSFCVRPRSDRLFSVLEISERNEQGDLHASPNKGFCDPSKTTDYVSEGRVVTQMTFVRPNTSGKDIAFDFETEGFSSKSFKTPDDMGRSAAECTEFAGYVTSVIPSLAPASVKVSEIGACFQKPRIPNTKESITVDACLNDLGVPYQTQVQVFVNQPLGINCISGK